MGSREATVTAPVPLITQTTIYFRIELGPLVVVRGAAVVGPRHRLMIASSPSLGPGHASVPVPVHGHIEDLVLMSYHGVKPRGQH